MAREDVNIKVSANVAEAIRLWKAMEDGPKGMARELDSMGQKGKTAAQGMASHLDSVVGKWTSIHHAIGLAKETLAKYVEFQRELRKLEGESSMKVDAGVRQFFIQSGGKVSPQSIQQNVLGVAAQRGMAPENAFKIATQMVSSGFSPQEAMGGSLGEMMGMFAATNAVRPGADMKELTRAVGLFMSATKTPMNKEGIHGVGSAIQSLFQKTNLQAGDLESFAPQAGMIQKMAHLKGPEILGLLSQMVQVTDPAKGAMAMRSGIVELATAGATPDKVKALKSIGLKPGDVDFQGEDFMEVQRRMVGAMQGVDPTTRNIAMRQLLGQRGLLFGTTVLTPEGMAQTQEFQKMAKDFGGYELAVQTGEGSMEAKKSGSESRFDDVAANMNRIDPEVAERNLLAAIKKAGGGRFAQTLAAGAFEESRGQGLFGAFTGPWGTVEESVYYATRMAGGNREMAQRIVEQSKPEPINVRVELTDQNQVTIPHKAEVHNVGKNNAAKGR